MAKLVKAGVTLRDQVNTRFPKRDKASDGWIGDAAHQDRESDHNPDKDGWVHAIDIDEDFGAKGDNRKFANQLIALAREGKDGGRLKYVVYEDRIASGTYADTFWTWRGSGYGHTQHIHVSFTAKAEKDGSPFDLAIFRQDLWDGHIPEPETIRQQRVSGTAGLAVYRLAARLYDLGFYTGAKPVQYEQKYPEKAVIAFQKAQGWDGTGHYGSKTHAGIFGEAP
jgi:hypothetical protein